MARVFRVLAAIVACVLFFFGCAGLGGTIVAHFAAGEAWQPLGAWAMTLAYLVLSVVIMKLRQMME